MEVMTFKQFGDYRRSLNVGFFEQAMSYDGAQDQYILSYPDSRSHKTQYVQYLRFHEMHFNEEQIDAILSENGLNILS